MVKIPFGRGNHLRTGYVIGFSDQTEYQPDRIKKIAELCDRSVPVEGRLLALAAWIRENYGSTMINAIRMVMPVKKTIRQLTDQMVVLTDQMDAEQLARVREQYQKNMHRRSCGCYRRWKKCRNGICQWILSDRD